MEPMRYDGSYNEGCAGVAPQLTLMVFRKNYTQVIIGLDLFIIYYNCNHLKIVFFMFVRLGLSV